jgi:hypothetical protein
LAASTARAAEVVHVGKSFIVIRAGTEDDLQDGDEVCVEDETGEKLGCGTVKVLRPRLAGIRLDADIAARVTKGMTATATKALPKAPADESEAAESAPPKRARKPPKSTDRERAAPRLTLDYLSSVRTPFQYRTPRYDLAAEIAGSGPLWRGEGTIDSSKAGLALSFAWPVGQRWLVAPGLHYRAPQEEALLLDYERDDPGIYLEAKTAASSSGLSIEAHHSLPLGRFELLTSGGLDFDRSVVRFSAIRKGSTDEASVARLDSTLLAVSLRLGVRLELVLGPFSVGLGVSGLLPFAGTASGSPSGASSKTEVDAIQAAAASADLKEALGHERTRYGTELSLGMSARF